MPPPYWEREKRAGVQNLKNYELQCGSGLEKKEQSMEVRRGVQARTSMLPGRRDECNRGFAGYQRIHRERE